MTSIPLFYPDFVPNQILTDSQLNQLRDYLDCQDRHARIRLIGTGIVCGLDWSKIELESQFSLTIASGYGITSAGLLVELPEATKFSRVRQLAKPKTVIGGDQDPLAEQIFDTFGNKVVAWELLTEGGDGPLDSEICDQSVLLLCLVERAEDLKSCLVTDCNNKGRNIHLEWRAVVVHGQVDSFTWPACQPETPAPTRIPLLHTQRPLPKIGTIGQLRLLYQKIFNNHVGDVRRGISAAYERYRRLLDLEPLGKIKYLIPAQPRPLAQSSCEALRHVATALDEAVAAACQVFGPCAPATGFDHHLMLGALDGTAGFRHLFVPSPRSGRAHGELEHARKLFHRLGAMARKQDFSAARQGIRLTPSHTEAMPLGERAMPFYFPLNDSELPALWQPQDCCTQAPLWSYHNPRTASGPSDLDFDAKRCSLIRIEGHHGMPCTQARDEILAQRRQHNVEFDVVVARFQRPAPDSLTTEIAELFDEQQEMAWKVRQRALRGSRSETQAFDIDEISKLADEFQGLSRRADEKIREWQQGRSRRPRCAATEAMQTDYRASRYELLCSYYRLRGELTKVAEMFDPPSYWDPGSGWGPENDAWPRDWADGLCALQIDLLVSELLIVGDTEEQQKRILSELRRYQQQGLWLPPWHLLVNWARHLRDILDLLVAGNILPEDLSEFSWPPFARLYGWLTSSLTVYWSYLKDFWQRANAISRYIDFWVPEPARYLDEFVHQVLADCRPARLAALATYYEAAQQGHDEGSWYFPDLVASHDGGVHHGGVPPGGTFVLICDRKDKVAADLAYHGKLVCCCAPPDPGALPCLPLVTLPFHDLVILERDAATEDYRDLNLRLDLLANAHDPNLRDGQLANDGLEIVLHSDTSFLGAPISVSDLGKVDYELKRPRPGYIDFFRYEIRQPDGRCGMATVRGHATLLFTALTAPPLIAPANGSISGQVIGDENHPKTGAEVQLSFGEKVITQTAQGDSAAFSFASLQGGVYRLQAFLDDLQSKTATVSLAPDGRETVTLVLESPVQRPGHIQGKVIDHADVPLPGLTVTLEPDGQVEVTKPDGGFRFRWLTPGNYNVSVSRKTKQVAVVSGEITPLTIKLPSQNHTGNIDVFVASEDSKEIPRGTRTSLRNAAGKEIRQASKPTGDRFKFVDVPAGNYRVVASAPGFVTAKKKADVSKGETSKIAIELQRSISPTVDRLVSDLAQARDIPVEKAQELVEGVYSKRQQKHRQQLKAAGTQIRTTSSYRSAEALLRNPLFEQQTTTAQVISAYAKATSTLGRAIRSAGKERKDDYRTVLRCVCQSFLDRLTVLEYQRLSAEAESALTALRSRITAADIGLEAFADEWAGDQLTDELGVEVARVILEALR